MRILFVITIISAFAACKEKKPPPYHTHVFKCYDKKSRDTSYFYGFKNMDTAISHARRARQNILLVFGGYTLEKNWESLVNYRDEAFISEHFKILWLPVDSNEPLKDSMTVVWHGKIRAIRTVGQQNTYFENTTFNLSNQPEYAFMDSLKRPLDETIGYETDHREIAEFIKSGLTR